MLAISQLKPVFTALILTSIAGKLDCHDWRHFTPRVQSQVKRLQRAEAQTLLAEFCESSLKLTEFGLTCSTRQLGVAFNRIVDNGFQPEGVIYGHFRAPNSEDAAVSGWSGETHPKHWGGTLLLTMRDGKWTPLSYKSAVITHSCHKAGLPSGRDILLCEDEDGGMGHALHYLYSVDLAKPLDIREANLVFADSSRDNCTVRRQEIQRVTWAQSARRLRVTVRTVQHRRDSSSDVCVGDPELAKRPSLTSTFTFELINSGFRAIGTTANGKPELSRR